MILIHFMAYEFKGLCSYRILPKYQNAKFRPPCEALKVELGPCRINNGS